MQQTAIMKKTLYKPARDSFINKLVKSRTLLLLTLPGLVILIINQYLPIFGVIIAFKNINYSDGIFFSPWAGLDNFKFLFATSDVWIALRNTVGYNLLFISLGMVLSVSIAIILNELRNKRLSRFYQSTIILPNFLSIIIVAYIVTTFLATETGVMNKVILPLLEMEPVDWYSQPKYWSFILPIVHFWKSAGVGSILYLSTLCGIDGELYEAAVVDGAKKLQQIRYITIPMLLPMMSILTILALGGIVRADFGLFFQVPMDTPLLYPATDVIDTYVYRSLMKLNDYGMSSAASLFQSMTGCILIVSVNLIVKKIDDNYSLF